MKKPKENRQHGILWQHSLENLTYQSVLHIFFMVILFEEAVKLKSWNKDPGFSGHTVALGTF